MRWTKHYWIPNYNANQKLNAILCMPYNPFNVAYEQAEKDLVETYNILKKI